MASFPPEHQPLRDDVRMLGALLGEVLKEQGGDALFGPVEAARLAARRRRAGEGEAESQLDALLLGLEPHDAEAIVRAFSAYFNLVNMAERVHRIRRRRDYLLHGDPQGGSLADVVATLAREGVPLDHVRSALARIHIQPVFTAHPTEAIRRTILAKAQRVARCLIERFQVDSMTPGELASNTARLRHEVTLTWQTEEHLRTRPTVADEVEHVLFYLTEVVYRVIPAFYDLLADALRRAYGDGAEAGLPSPVVTFASWVGGDMDGNPNVDAGTIRATLRRQRHLILARYRSDVRALFDHLSQSTSRVAASDAVLERIEALRRLLPDTFHEIPHRYHDMPYRVLLWFVAARLDATDAGGLGAYTSPDELRDDIDTIAASLLSHRGVHAGYALVQRLRRRVDTFGLHLATLDVRQHAAVHRRAAAAVLRQPELGGWPPPRRAEALAQALSCATLGDVPGDAETERTLDVFRAIAESRAAFGERAVGPYIISMAEGPDDVLAVLLLARTAGLADRGGNVPLDVAPLFETVEDLEGAPAALAALLDTPAYAGHLEARGRHQTVMLGYSDSGKRAGLPASRWALYRAQSQLVATADAAEVALTLFHGRGGTASRGGSKPRSAILAAPPEAVRGRFRVTEQGEIIHAKYGLRGIAERTLELVTGAVLEVTAREAEAPRPVPEWYEAMEAIAAESRRAFRALVYEDPDFDAYFRAATPIDVIERLPIGSRPSSRKQGGAIDDLRAIPWTFAWVQSRHLLPGWYGVGAGLEAAAVQFGPDRLQAMAQGWPFFANLLGDVEMVLGKADLGIAARYAELAGEVGARIFPRIRAEYERTRAWVCRVQGIGDVLEREATLRRAIHVRNPYVDPMSFVQVGLLRRWRAGGRTDPALERALFTTVRGIARGMQNTG